MSLVQPLPVQTRPTIVPKSTVFTCLACQVAFPTGDRQRAHYRTDWHKYNLKRKIAELAPIDAEQFAHKVLAQQAIGREQEERSGLVYECPTCKKYYGTENAFVNHVQSRKHQETEQRALLGKSALARVQNEGRLFSDHSDMEEEGLVEPMTATAHPSARCLFCSHTSDTLENNLSHMYLTHGFFLPDREYLKDVEGLVLYLASKINNGICLYCNGRGKEWKSVEAVRSHMADKGHCKMAYDDTEDPEQLLAFYDFEPFEESGSEEDTPGAYADTLVLGSGVRLGHRKFMRYFKQRHTHPLAQEDVKVIEAAEEGAPETLRRKERRHLAITEGQEEAVQRTVQGIQEAKYQQEFQRRVGIKSNRLRNLRARTQNPI
ncbi:C2H2 type zinc-finger-domain-containing protein [Spinellus fusiger]|nr:C2H2 type zinc-finger-domain-containing protein [Spinellus fusiger]